MFSNRGIAPHHTTRRGFASTKILLCLPLITLVVAGASGCGRSNEAEATNTGRATKSATNGPTRSIPKVSDKPLPDPPPKPDANGIP